MNLGRDQGYDHYFRRLCFSAKKWLFSGKLMLEIFLSK
jgi:hypothetical protein